MDFQGAREGGREAGESQGCVWRTLQAHLALCRSRSWPSNPDEEGQGLRSSRRVPSGEAWPGSQQRRVGSAPRQSSTGEAGLDGSYQIS